MRTATNIITALLLFVVAPCFAANPAYVSNSGGNSDVSVQTIECSPATSIVDGNLLLLHAYASDDITISVDESGWTTEEHQVSNAGGDNAHAVFSKVASSESGNYTVNISGGVGKQIHCTVTQWENVHATAMDVSPTFTVDLVDDDTPDAPNITTANDNSMVITSIGAFGSTSGAKTPPSGYTTSDEQPATNHHLEVSHKLVTTAGTETIGDWTDLGVNADSTVITIALRSEDAGSGSVVPITVNHARRRR